jgi:hypothetical protein
VKKNIFKMPFTAIAAPKCPACKTSVYPAEQVMAGDRKPYHRGCVKCFQCRVNLNPRTLNNHEDQLFCNVCYENIFNPADFTVGLSSGIITPEDIERQKEKERLEKEKMERALQEKRCPVCTNKIYPEGSIVISEVPFHRTCVKCIECMRSFDGKDMALGPPGDANPKPYCKFCFAKTFGISALNITEMVMIAPEQNILSQGL